MIMLIMLAEMPQNSECLANTLSLYCLAMHVYSLRDVDRLSAVYRSSLEEAPEFQRIASAFDELYYPHALFVVSHNAYLSL